MCRLFKLIDNIDFMNRNKMILGAVVLALSLPLQMRAKASCSDNSTRLWYNAPAQQWLEALPIGNSHLGGMVSVSYTHLRAHET